MQTASYKLYRVGGLEIKVGQTAQCLLESQGLKPALVSRVVGAAGGPKGLILNPLDQFLFSEFFPKDQQLELIGASIGAWRMTAACATDPVLAFQDLLLTYANQHYTPRTGERTIGPDRISEIFRSDLASYFEKHSWKEVLQQRTYNLNIVVTRGENWLKSQNRWKQNLGFLGLIAHNAWSRHRLDNWAKRILFYSHHQPNVSFDELKTEYQALNVSNAFEALLASCSIPFVLDPVVDIPEAPKGNYWDGGITDYHLSWNYSLPLDSVTLYPHFQKEAIPGWFDKSFKRRHRWNPRFDSVILLYPSAEMVSRLPRKKIPDRNDFKIFGNNLEARKRAWFEDVKHFESFIESFQKFTIEPMRYAVD